MSKNHHSPAGSRRSLADTTREAAEDMRHDAESLGRQAKEAVQEKAGELRDRAERVAGDFKDAASERMEQAREGAQHMYDAGRQQIRDLEKGIEAQIREKPLTALCIAGGLGLIIGMLWARR